MERQPHDGSVYENTHAAEQEALARDQRHHSQVHRVADVTIEPGDHEALGWQGRRRSAETLDGEPREGIEKHRETGGKKEHSNGSNH